MPPEAATESWSEGFSDENKEVLKGFESQEKLFEAINYKIPEPVKAVPADWREGLNEEEKKDSRAFH